MKTVTFWRVLAVFLLTACLVQPLLAVDVYLADDGNDGNTGTAGDPVATLAKAYSLCTGSTNNIYVDGFIDLTQETTPVSLIVPRTVTIDGGDPATSGFDGGNSVRLINFAGNSGLVTFKNIAFRNANSSSDDANLDILNTGTFLFENCKFYNNTYTGNSNNGNIRISNTSGNTVTFDNCEFYNNIGHRGAALWIGANAVTTIKNCHFHDNAATGTTGNGGAIYLGGSAIGSLEKCIFEANSASSGAAIENGAPKLTMIDCVIQNNPNGGLYSSNTSGELFIQGCLFKENISSIRAGAGMYTANLVVYIESSAFIGNSTTVANLHGGGIRFQQAPGSKFTMINSTVAQNSADNSRGTGMAVEGNQNIATEYSFINTTFVDNFAINRPGDDAAGLAIYESNNEFLAQIKIYNSIFENNKTSNGNVRDMWFRAGKPSSGDQGHFSVYNSFVQYVYGNNASGTSIFENGDVVNSYFSGRGWTGAPFSIPNNWSSSGFGSYDVASHSYPLTSSANARDFGSAEYLLDAKSVTDQTGATRKNIARGIVDAGAVEYALPDYVIADETGKSSTEYLSDTYGDIIFTSGDDFTVAASDESGSNYYGVKFKKTVEADKWYAIGFPFDVIGFYCEDFEYGKSADESKSPILSITDGDFTVKTFTDDTGNDYHFDSYSENKLYAGEGYIVSFPSDFDGREITFVSEFNPALTNNAEIATITPESYQLLANPSVATVAPESLQADFSYYTFDGDNLFIPSVAAIAPFEAFIAVTGVETSALRTAVAIDQSLVVANKQVVNNGNLIDTQYYNLQGIKIQRPAKGGIYLVKQLYDTDKTIVKKMIF